MKKLRGVSFIILINIVSIILLEYVYSQRWRLQTPVDSSLYKELIIGEWEQDTKNYYFMDHLYNPIEERKYLTLTRDFKYETTSNIPVNTLSYTKSTWELEGTSIKVNGYKDYAIPPEFYTDGIPPEKQYFSYTLPIRLLNRMVLVFDVPDDDLYFFQIPRKKVYYSTL